MCAFHQIIFSSVPLFLLFSVTLIVIKASDKLKGATLLVPQHCCGVKSSVHLVITDSSWKFKYLKDRFF